MTLRQKLYIILGVSILILVGSIIYRVVVPQEEFTPPDQYSREEVAEDILAMMEREKEKDQEERFSRKRGQFNEIVREVYLTEESKLDHLKEKVVSVEKMVVEIERMIEEEETEERIEEALSELQDDLDTILEEM